MQQGEAGDSSPKRWRLSSSEMASTVAEYFAGKPDSRRIFDVLADRIAALGPSEIEVKSQISFGVNRKFAWFLA
jgi:hypothetical protein